MSLWDGSILLGFGYEALYMPHDFDNFVRHWQSNILLPDLPCQYNRVQGIVPLRRQDIIMFRIESHI